MRFTVRTTQRSKSGRFASADAMAKRAVERGLAAWGFIIVAKAKELIMTGPKTGRFYGLHQASAPGEPPANDTGRLAGSVGWEFTTTRTAIRIKADAVYAIQLEFGNSKMAPRPFLRRSILETEAQGRKLIDAEVFKSFRG
jgi:hypothetical protein